MSLYTTLVVLSCTGLFVTASRSWSNAAFRYHVLVTATDYPATEEKFVRLLIFTWCLLTTLPAMAETWVCRHDSPDREELTFMPKPDGTVAWRHQKLGSLDPLTVVVDTDSLLTMATQRLNILYSRFFHLDKFSGRMGETTFRASTLRRLAEKDPELNWDMVTTVWQCESKAAESK